MPDTESLVYIGVIFVGFLCMIAVIALTARYMKWIPAWINIPVVSIVFMILYIIYERMDPGEMLALEGTRYKPDHDMADYILPFIIIFGVYSFLYMIVKPIVTPKRSESTTEEDEDWEIDIPYINERPEQPIKKPSKGRPTLPPMIEPEPTSAVEKTKQMKAWVIVLITTLALSVVVGTGIYIYKLQSKLKQPDVKKKKKAKPAKKPENN